MTVERVMRRKLPHSAGFLIALSVEGRVWLTHQGISAASSIWTSSSSSSTAALARPHARVGDHAGQLEGQRDVDLHDGSVSRGGELGERRSAGVAGKGS